MIIQACQATNHTALPSEYFDAAVASPCENRGGNTSFTLTTTESQTFEDSAVILSRPHTALLFATSEGQPARRGAFTAAIAAQIMTADGRKDISSMFDLAVHETIPVARFKYQQIPEMRKTTSKKLIFPPALHNAGNISPEQTQLVVCRSTLFFNLMMVTNCFVICLSIYCGR